MAKSVANYANSALIKMEAVLDGYSEGIALDVDGHLSEGSGQNLFLVRDEILYTPPLSASVLPGITRDSIMTLAHDLGFQVREQDLPREMLYVADEVFFSEGGFRKKRPFSTLPAPALERQATCTSRAD